MSLKCTKLKLTAYDDIILLRKVLSLNPVEIKGKWNEIRDNTVAGSQVHGIFF